MLAQGVARKLRSEGEIKPPKVPGDAQAAYYTPLKTDKTPAKFLKAKPNTAAVLCEKVRPVRQAVSDGRDRPGKPDGNPRNVHQMLCLHDLLPDRRKEVRRPGFPVAHGYARAVLHRGTQGKRIFSLKSEKLPAGWRGVFVRFQEGPICQCQERLEYRHKTRNRRQLYPSRKHHYKTDLRLHDNRVYCSTWWNRQDHLLHHILLFRRVYMQNIAGYQKSKHLNIRVRNCKSMHRLSLFRLSKRKKIAGASLQTGNFR